MEEDDFVEAISFWTDSPADAFWHFLIDIDAEAILEYRRLQRAALARYGKQSWTQWDELDIEEMEQAYASVSDLVKRENALSRANEDR